MHFRPTAFNIIVHTPNGFDLKIAVIGAGIAGMGCAWALSKVHDVVLLEKDARIGGHSRTLDVPVSGKTVPVDTGFIVFNRPNYPNLFGLFDHLNVPYVKSAMSFGVSLGGGTFEYGTGGISSFLGQVSNLFKPRFWRMFFDIVRFNRSAKDELDGSLTLGELLDKLRLGKDFRNRYLLPMAASIWSTPQGRMLDFPAEPFLRFFDNHGLLTLFSQPQWYTVEGGSKEYVQRLVEDYSGGIRLSSNIEKVTRAQEGVVIQFSGGETQEYDGVVFACHADQSRTLLSDIDAQEYEVLKDLNFQTNRVITHKDARSMPKRRRCWSSWIYLDETNTAENAEGNRKLSLTYWMNNLQPLKTDESVFVTLNPDELPSDFVDEWTTEHPRFDQAAIDAQKSLAQIQGHRNTYYCGAWTRFGFHEDGLRSGLDVAEKLGATVPWRSDK